MLACKDKVKEGGNYSETRAATVTAGESGHCGDVRGDVRELAGMLDQVSLRRDLEAASATATQPQERQPQWLPGLTGDALGQSSGGFGDFGGFGVNLPISAGSEAEGDQMSVGADPHARPAGDEVSTRSLHETMTQIVRSSAGRLCRCMTSLLLVKHRGWQDASMQAV